MNYSIHITAAAERDIIRAADYIEFILKNPTAADHLLNEIETWINSLSELPPKFHLVDDPVLSNWNIRFLVIQNYLAFYTIDPETYRVIIVGFLYQKSDWNRILYQGISMV